MNPNRAHVSERILILAPTGRDADLAVKAIEAAGFAARACRSAAELCEEMEANVGAVIVTEEALTPEAMQHLSLCLDQQAPWSDIPMLVFTSRPTDELQHRSLDELGSRANITILERPIRVETMLTAVAAALRARRRQYQVRELFTELRRRIYERDQFLAMLSHELRNPLAAIALAVEAIEKQPELTNERAIIVRQTRHLSKLADDLLDIARVTTGKISLQRRTVDLNDVVEHCVHSMRQRADARRLRLTLHLPEKHSTVNGDAVRLEQIANNLLSNAIKYTPPGGEIDVYVETSGADAVLRVRDSGKGIPSEMLTSIFDMFTQGETTLDRSEGGMGIGLNLVKKLVELHGGNVRAYSGGRGSGSEFVVRIPLSTDGAAAEKQDDSRVAQMPRRIVVVEDNADIRDLLRVKLRHLGHSVEAAADGASGLDAILNARPDAALVDIGLPVIDGYELARRVREQVGRSIYLIALTGYGQSDDKRRAVEAGFDVHLTKPVDFIDLQNVLSRIPGAKDPSKAVSGQ